MEIKIKSIKEFLNTKMGCGDTLELTFEKDEDSGEDSKILFFFERKGFFRKELSILINPQKFQEFYTLYKKRGKTFNESLRMDSIKRELFNNK